MRFVIAFGAHFDLGFYLHELVVCMGVISPSKLRIKLLGTRSGAQKKEGGNSPSRASPSKLEEMEHSKSSLLAEDFEEEVGFKESKGATSLSAIVNSEVPRLELSVKNVLSYSQGDQTPSFRKDFLSKVKVDICCNKTRDAVKSDPMLADSTSNLNTVHPVQIPEDGIAHDGVNDNGSVRSFEFHKGDRLLQQQVASPLLKNLPSKWNDAERWILHRQIMHLKPNVPKKVVGQNLGCLEVVSNKLAPEYRNVERHSFLQEADSKYGSVNKSASQTVTEKFSFTPTSSPSNLNSTTGASGLTDLSSVTSCYSKPNAPENPTTNISGTPDFQSVSMRDVGTEMTPIPSQDPSRTGTPVGATTPIRSPLSSTPSSPKKETPPSTPAGSNTQDELKMQKNVSNIELSDKDVQLKTRREIAALGIQLGKLNIASWASKDDKEHTSSSLDSERIKISEFEARAVAWEESQKSVYTFRYSREEAKIQAWEDHQKAKYEMKLRRIEAQAEWMKAQAQGKMVKKLAVTHRRVEQKQALAEAKRKRQATRTAKQAEQIRRTGHISMLHFWCCSWFC
ncbi:uncharacterized protein LOC122005612 isoform X1 [Zingiber officinale]|uniref:uncharacterized protein LOC122005612 isoform X1 n=1 Tax=Zingiber officinale TaxID=94328 RepID=UPI001C4CDBE6|nr:uncharacterized protein LOC122005612 isoform X1 [Zingiber officinale]